MPTSLLLHLCTYQRHAPPTPGRAAVGDSSPKLVPRVGTFAARLAILGHIASDYRDK